MGGGLVDKQGGGLFIDRVRHIESTGCSRKRLAKESAQTNWCLGPHQVPQKGMGGLRQFGSTTPRPKNSDQGRMQATP